MAISPSRSLNFFPIGAIATVGSKLDPLFMSFLVSGLLLDLVAGTNERDKNDLQRLMMVTTMPAGGQRTFIGQRHWPRNRDPTPMRSPLFLSPLRLALVRKWAGEGYVIIFRKLNLGH